MQHQYDPYEIKLANEIANTLNDRGSILLHLKYVRKYQEEVLRKILAKVMAVHEDDITSSRGALYNSLVMQYEKYGGPRD
jgi:hypothetical protein